MNENPIWTKDNMLSDRSLFMPMLISFTNLVLLILFIANLYYISLNGLQTGEIRYAGFLQIYYLVAAGLFLFSPGDYRIQSEHGRGRTYAGTSFGNGFGQ